MKKTALPPASPTPAPLAALSHEFRTPLNGVLGMARLLEGTKLTAEQRTYVEALRQCGDHLLSLVNDVLDLAKLDAGKLTLNPAPVRFGDLLQQTAELLSPRAHAKGLEIAWASPRNAPTVLADEGRLRQVLLNLAGNAIKFTETGGVLLGVEVCDGAAPGLARLRLTVADTGPGVPLARQREIFEPFTQADERHSARTDSTGLGLAIVQRLADAHDGKVGVVSAPGAGATFWFEADYPVVAKAAPASPLKGLTVVVASPSFVLREAASRQIRAKAGRPIICATVEEAASRAPAGSVILIDGALAQSGCVSPPAGHPCLILLPPESRSRIVRSRKAGFAGYLIKPLRETSLADRVLAALGPKGAAPAHHDDERADETVKARGARVLLVEDNPINALLARKLLEREGCEVEHVGTAEAALEAATLSAFSLILMDRRLPGVDGLTGTRQLRAAGISVPIVALTADAFEEDRRACLAAGMDDFLTKPLDPAALRVILARAQGRRLVRLDETPRGRQALRLI